MIFDEQCGLGASWDHLEETGSGQGFSSTAVFANLLVCPLNLDVVGTRFAFQSGQRSLSCRRHNECTRGPARVRHSHVPTPFLFHGTCMAIDTFLTPTIALQYVVMAPNILCQPMGPPPRRFMKMQHHCSVCELAITLSLDTVAHNHTTELSHTHSGQLRVAV